MEKILSASASKEMYQIVSKLNQLFSEIHTAFMKNRLSLKYRQALEKLGKQISMGLVEFSESARQMDKNEALTVHATAVNLSKIFYDLLRLATQVEKKINSRTRFTNAAIKEMNDILCRTVSVLPHVADGLRTCNPVILAHVHKEVDTLRRDSANSINFHEDRLCEGKCHPRACIVYMQMLQHLQNILWHYKAMICRNNFPT
ncbi:Na/Pi cotransporter family protein [Dethiobacter alkaliphilus]|uniref:Uncharacterized protein n=1 Tax=Dethiobacter alkaliphilus AHT 1 TaxID=555088 RepID=C0GDA5_DETAL|nr:hypothetical protein [Dethiobacter alkaliphilus]EEG78626.1 hypothetical protein DealDRAFT_0556 [Dethiobacter alkaliphilus AHT 1]